MGITVGEQAESSASVFCICVFFTVIEEVGETLVQEQLISHTYQQRCVNVAAQAKKTRHSFIFTILFKLVIHLFIMINTAFFSLRNDRKLWVIGYRGQISTRYLHNVDGVDSGYCYVFSKGTLRKCIDCPCQPLSVYGAIVKCATCLPTRTSISQSPPQTEADDLRMNQWKLPLPRF